MTTALPDSVRTLPPIVVRAKRPSRQEALDQLPNEASVVEIESVRDRFTTTAEIIDRVPGLHVSNYGGPYDFTTISIRGSATNQVSLYLDGVPLSRSSLGVVGLADLPLASLEHVEVYRGSAPAQFPGATLGGAVNLVTRGANPSGPPMRRAALLAGGGSYGTLRAGMSQEIVRSGWSGLLVADHVESDGDFEFHDDNGTPLEPSDDEDVPRRNNWVRRDEVLARIGRALPRKGELRVFDQWVRAEHGVPGISSHQSTRARTGAQWNLASAEVRFAQLAGAHLDTKGRAFYEWRRDTFSDPANEIGLGYQANRDVTHNLGGQWLFEVRLPHATRITTFLEGRHERLIPWRGFPQPHLGPEQSRTTWLAGSDALARLGRVSLQAGLRATRQTDAFEGDLRTPYSQRPARSGRTTWVEPRFGARLQLIGNLALRGTWGRYHRAPEFHELFGDGGSIAGSSDLVAETGTNRDLGLLWTSSRAALDWRLSFAHFDNHVEHFITPLPQSQRTFVYRNIGGASLRGEEWAWRLADPRSRWALEGSFTDLEARDLGLDSPVYAGKVLPGRPAQQIWQRASLRLGRIDLGFNFDRLGNNYLDRFNSFVVVHRDLYGLDARIGWRGFSVAAEVSNLTDERAYDVAAFPLPGRLFFLTTSYKH